jgi:hypothetical protein
MPYTEFHYTPTGTGVISGKEVLEQTEDAINDLGGQISGDVQTAIDTANNALNTANTASADAQNAVNTANTAYTAATNAQNTANTAQNTASNALTAAQNAQNDVNALGNRVTTAENNITQNTSDISGLTTRMGTAEGNITTLQNDVITAQGAATSAQNTATLARGQAYVVRYASVAVSDNSTVPYTDLNNTDNVKVNDLLLDINGKFYQITSVDTSNETVSVTTPLTQLAVDSDVVHKSGDETVGGVKTFNNVVPINGAYLGNEPSTSFRSVLLLRSRYDTAGKSGWLVSKFRSNSAQGALSGSDSVFLNFDVLENEVRTNGILRFNLSNWSGNAPGTFSLYPKTGMTCNLGVSANKWTRINGLNPSSLSMPDLDNGIDISGYITDLTGASNINKYTPTVNGWISIGLSSADFIEIYIPSSLMGGTFTKSTINNYSQAFMPVIANKEVRFALKGSSIGWAKFYPCFGNV